jgi:hypothetical protein
MRSYIKKFLKRIDLFRIPAKVTIQEEDKIKTVFGGIVSIFFYCSCILFFIA